MTTYIDSGRTRPRYAYNAPEEERLDWAKFTEARLRWLYGPDHSIERRAMTQADLAAWRRLGEGRPAA